MRFNKKRWAKVLEDHNAWWNGELKRPIIQIRLDGYKSDRQKSQEQFELFTSFHDNSIVAEEIIDAMDYQLSCTKYLGDAFPCAWPNFGAGVIAAFLGASLNNGNKTVWFHPKEECEISDIHFKYDPDNFWLKRIKEICQAGIERWQGNVQISMTDLGGNLDVLSAFRPSEGLLFDLYDYPEEIKQLTWATHDLWFKYFDEINAILQPVNPGYSAWQPFLASEPYYMLQCDFCYMIGPDQFEEFVKPELIATCNKLPYPFYHLDGEGQLPHLDSLLQIESLKGIQWVPTHKSCDWADVFRKIHEAGKLVEILVQPHHLKEADAVIQELGFQDGIIMIIDGTAKDEAAMLEFARKYNAESTV
jgi:5-methyltetrahydrofolate--homocysteine methyltransferase